MTDSIESTQTKPRFQFLRENPVAVVLVGAVMFLVVVDSAVSIWVAPSPQSKLTNLGFVIEEGGSNSLETMYRRLFATPYFSIRTANLNNLTEQDLEKATALINELNGLKGVNLRYNSKIEDLMGFQKGKHFEFFTVENCEKLKTLKGLSGHMQIGTLRCKQCPDLRGMGTTEALSSVLHLEITDCPQFEKYNGLAGMTNLHSMRLKNIKRSPDLSELVNASKLQTLVISSCETPTDLEGIEKLTQLKNLNLVWLSIPQSRIDEIQKALPNTIITSVPKPTE